MKAPTKSDYMKLTRLVKYTRRTIHLPLHIGWSNGSLTWNVDASFVVHQDFRSHTDATMTLRKGSLIALSIKQKINTKSSTEAELVRADDAMDFVV